MKNTQREPVALIRRDYSKVLNRKLYIRNFLTIPLSSSLAFFEKMKTRINIKSKRGIRIKTVSFMAFDLNTIVNKAVKSDF